MKKQLVILSLGSIMMMSSLTFAYPTAHTWSVYVVKNDAWSYSACEEEEEIVDYPGYKGGTSRDCLVSQTLPRYDIDEVQTSMNCFDCEDFSYASWRFWDVNDNKWHTSVDWTDVSHAQDGVIYYHANEDGAIRNDDYDSPEGENIMKIYFRFSEDQRNSAFYFKYPAF